MRLISPLVLLAFLIALPTQSEAQDISAEPTFGDVRLSAGFLPDPHVVELTAGGSIAVELGSCDYGFVANAPDVDFYYDGDGQQTLYVWVVSNDDTTLLINTPGNRWRCDDDSFGNLDPILVIPNAPSGLYNFWVGTYSDELARARLYISEIDPR